MTLDRFKLGLLHWLYTYRLPRSIPDLKLSLKKQST